MDHRGTRLTSSLLDALLRALHDPATGRPHLGDAWFEEASFPEEARFNGTHFSGEARFVGAHFAGAARFSRASFGAAWFERASFTSESRFGGASFSGEARFGGALFHDRAVFGHATFSETAWFSGARFLEDARFDWAVFSGDARFGEAAFSGDARFSRVRFHRMARFERVAVAGDALFGSATFDMASQLGPIACPGTLDLWGATFGAPMTVTAAAARVSCRWTRWASTGALRLRGAALDLSDAVLEYPLSVTTHKGHGSVHAGGYEDEDRHRNAPTGPARITSLSGMDAAHLVLTDVDLSECRFTRTIHLDQLGMGGRCIFAAAPEGVHRKGWRAMRWSPRHTLAEEHHWRTSRGAPGWMPAPEEATPVGPEVLAPVYRQLRKSFEDGKNEPDAADFYYGEMEMRRYDRHRPLGERVLLTLYWAVSGYGLRASRALAWLTAAMTITVALMMGLGLPDNSPGQEIKRVRNDDRTRTIIAKQEPELTLSVDERLTTKRFEDSLRIVLNSVVFRSSEQHLTTWGNYIEMASRFSEPVLLGLAALAVRGRIKRG
ncbi:pentapeptide repeat-containing protein [Streptomyces sp. 3N207]|uniref:pentapeptide repeat-containing protein n=1 Tax=Streptomyces sp. 3N207 TaxID=3457417 RepID=UPI003FD29CB6